MRRAHKYSGFGFRRAFGMQPEGNKKQYTNALIASLHNHKYSNNLEEHQGN